MFDHPGALFPLSMLLLWLSTRLAIEVRGRLPLRDDEREDFGIVLAASLPCSA